MMRISFRQSMLAGFLLIALLSSWAAVRSWLVLESFVEQSRQAGEQALQLSASIQELAERSVDLERSTRQFMVLGDPVLLERFDENLVHSLAAVERLEALPGQPLAQLPAGWRQAVDSLRQTLRGSLAEGARLGAGLPLLNGLAEINADLASSGRQWIEAQQASMLTELERSRVQLTGQVAAAVLGAFMVALIMGWWLSRPIRSLERAIERLGESRFDEPVLVRGPADLRQVGRRLDWLRQRLGELEAERERALRHVSHELKTPLTALREGIALLQEEVAGTLHGEQKEVVDILQSNVMTLQGQIESLLRLNAASFEARRLSHRPQQLRQLLAEALRGRELQIQARRLRVVRDAPALTLLLDAEKLLVVLDNLLSNAIDFSPEGGVIRLQAGMVQGRLRVDCIDQGPGIAAEDAERIFQPFVQGLRASPMPRQGSGVGLSIVRELMTAMGGRVLLLAGEGPSPGAHFRIEVPCEA